MHAHFLVTLAFILVVSTETSASNLRETIQDAFAAVRELEPMGPGAVYTVKVNGVNETGRREQFLRRRTSSDILASKLSCGCGDNASVFLNVVERAGFETLLVDSVEISSASILNTFSGHAVVAVREKGTEENGSWHLVDSTSLKIISETWSREDRTFETSGRLFWVGYCGPAAEYPIHTPAELKEFYAKTLEDVPQSMLESRLVRLKFSIDPSLLNSDGSFVNPRVPKFIDLQDSILQKHAIEPKRTVSILLKRGSDDARSSLTFTEGEGWIALVGTKSGCSAGLLDYMEGTVREHLELSLSKR